MKLVWQSKSVLLAVLPFAAASLVLQTHWWATQSPPVAIWTLGLCGLFGLVVLNLRAATRGGAFAGTIITASLLFSTAIFPYRPWQTALVPVVVLFVLTTISTRLGRSQKERLGTAERRHGRSASQVAANLGVRRWRPAWATGDLPARPRPSGWPAPSPWLNSRGRS